MAHFDDVDEARGRHRRFHAGGDGEVAAGGGELGGKVGPRLEDVAGGEGGVVAVGGDLDLDVLDVAAGLEVSSR